MALWPVGKYRKINWKRYWYCIQIVLPVPRDFPLSDAVEISRLRFTALEMTGGVVSLEMTGGVVSLEMTESVVSLEMTGGVVSLEMTEIVVSVEMTDGVVAGREIPQNQLETGLVLYPDSFASPRDFPVSDAVEISRLRFTPLEMTGGVVADRNDWWRCGRSK